MAYSNFTIEQVCQKFGIKVVTGKVVAKAAPVPPPSWLREILAIYRDMAYISEKSRGEMVLTPILAGCRVLLNNEVYFYSGVTFDVDAEKGLVGLCDYLFSWTAPTPVIVAPLLFVVEAKKDDLYQGLGQCAAQMLAARIFNEQRKHPIPAVFGCVTTGKDWQFLKLEQNELLIHDEDFFINDVDHILGMMIEVLNQGLAQARIAAA